MIIVQCQIPLLAIVRSWNLLDALRAAHELLLLYRHLIQKYHIGWILCKVQNMDDNCGEWVECMGVASGCGEQEAGAASGSGWNLWVWLLGVVVRRYIDFLILLIPTLVSVLFYSSIPTFCSFF